MLRRSRFVLAVAALLLTGCASTAPSVGGANYADESGSAARGFAFVSAQCASCHEIGSADRLSPVAEAPRFADVAAMPGLTRTALRAWLRSEHPTMPHLVVDDASVDDIYAYLNTLRERR